MLAAEVGYPADEPSACPAMRSRCGKGGTFRKHMLNEDGSIRDSVYFSIVDDEWPALKAMLEAKLARG